LLPSKAIRALCKQVAVVALRRDDPCCAELREEFAIPFLNSWVVVLDRSGETLASWMGDGAGAGCTDRSAARFARNLAKLIRVSLERKETVEELERRWKAWPQDLERFERLNRRLQEMNAHGRLGQLCQEAAANPALPGSQRDGFRIRAFIARAYDGRVRHSTRAARARFVREGERLLVELAGHPEAGGLVSALFAAGYAHAFDVPGRSARAIARLERACHEAADAAPLKERIGEFARMREEWIAVTTEALGKMKDTFGKRYFGALLGDAQAAIKFCSRPPYRDYPRYREWLRDARRKVEREGSRAGAR
jgi:hypothetical protein